MIRMFLLASSLTASLVAQTPPPNPPQFVAWPKLPRYVESIALQTKPLRVWVAGEGLFRSSVRPVPGDPKRSGFEDVTPPAIPSDRQTIFDIKFSEDGSLGWIAGRNGQIYRTKDAGETWIAATMTPVPERFSEGDFRRISFSPDGRRGIGLAQHGIWFSEDSGEHWTRTLRQDAWSDACLLADGRTAWAVGVGGWTTQSKDGGRTWKEVSASTFVPVIPGFKQHLNRVVFHANGRQGWIAGDGNTIIRTQNGGRSWHRATVPADAYIESIVDLAFDTSGQYGWAVARGGSDGGLLLRSADWGENWDITSAVPANYRALAMAADGLSGWAVAGTSVLQTLTKTAAPKIKHFAVIPPDLTPEITFEDEDTPQENLRGTIEVEGPGLGLGGNKVRVTFGSDADGLDWPKGAFAEGQKYTFHLRVFDGWNVTAQDLEYAPSKGGKAVSSIPAPIVGLDLPELKGLDLSKATVRLDGAPIAVAQLITRGGDGTLALKPSADTLQKLRDGFHSITVSNGLPNVMRQIGFYKEQLALKLFRPYRRSYALVVAVGDYPAGSGFSKLTSAVPQGRKLEAALRSQGFEILPSLYDRDATRSRIETAIRSAPAGPEDRLFIYFGGHGDDQKGFLGKQVGYLIPYDGRKEDLWGTAIPLEKLVGEYSTRLPAKHVLFALDSCQSGLATTRGNPTDLTIKALADIDSMTSEPGRTILSAGTGGQDALDVSGGIFTAALIDGIKGNADLDHNGVVDYYELFTFVWGRVNSESRAWVRKQQPADYHLGNGRWVFIQDQRILQ